MSDKPLSIEFLALKAAFDRACKMAGGGVRMAAALGVSEPTISRWKSANHSDAIPAELFCKIDAVAGYSWMIEAMSALAGGTFHKDDPIHTDMPLCSIVGNVGVGASKALQAVLVADADGEITPREFGCIDAEWAAARADGNRMVDVARAKCFGASGAKLAAAE